MTIRLAFIISLLLGLFFSNTSFSQSSNDSEYVSFTLRNESLKDIKLFIPGVMNPNLTALGNSGVTLKIGQEVLFKYDGKKRVLLVAEENLSGQVLKVKALLDQRIKEIEEEKD